MKDPSLSASDPDVPRLVELEPLAIERAKLLFGVEHANVQRVSGFS